MTPTETALDRFLSLHDSDLEEKVACLDPGTRDELLRTLTHARSTETRDDAAAVADEVLAILDIRDPVRSRGKGKGHIRTRGGVVPRSGTAMNQRVLLENEWVRFREVIEKIESALMPGGSPAPSGGREGVRDRRQ